ncbi:MAG: rod shape-determining protein MreC [Candidatus Omnitrophica bacterium]|nr:rod shape-determining protein MreC [Candidatus Omnitrophota bacterium]
MLDKKVKNLIYVIVLLVPFILFFTKSQYFSSIRFAVINTFNKPLKILSFPLKEIKKILYYHHTFEEYKKLRRQVDLLNARMVGMEEVIRENTRLEQLLEFKRNLLYSSVAASVIGRDPTQWRSSMIIDKGNDDGIEVGMAVVNALGVVGKIAETDAKTSKVMLITDPEFSVTALVQGTRESGVVTGTLQGLCRLRYVNRDARVKPGQKVITSKLSVSFPESILIGRVIDVRDDENYPSPQIMIEPAVSFSQLEEVLVVIK